MSFFKDFLDKFSDGKDSDDDTVTVKGKPKPKYYGTVAPYPDFCASSDASVLQAAIDGKEVDKDVIIAMLVKRNNNQRQKIKVVYEASAGRKLEEDLKSALRSDLEDVCLALLMLPAHFDAHLLRKATKHWGTDEKVLTEVLATRTNQEILEIKRAFNEKYGEELEEVIKDETEGHFTDALLALLKAKRDESTEVNKDQVQSDAESLFEAGENCESIDVPRFIEILTTRNTKQLSETFMQYKKISDNSLPVALKKELKGDIEDCLTDIVKSAWSKPAFFAEKLHQAMERHGTCEDTLIRVLVSRSEVDLKKIVEEYRAMYDISLQETILNDTKGHLQSILLGLCGPN